ncbi:hypothetical protein GIB67_015712 [Kingdonia uniflora]|uniref:Prephenate dehydratase domain-containing protein n=1 Tax=Kingdonia uniflora TaxID=39325 RepID=A0A7J7NUM8_9MAGN|nr:hypothetical protein GIB67_015712 [Kingdonia uniflora]
MYLTKLGIVRESVDDTAGAAQFVALNRLKDTRAVASTRAGDIYGLKVLTEKILDDFENITYFLILAREPIVPKADRPFKTSIVFTLEEGPRKLVEPTRVNDQYLTNILLKINGNLGGLNSMLTTEHGLNIPVISKPPAMMLGMDVLHGSPSRLMCLLFLSELLLDFYTSSRKRKPDQIIVFRWEDGHKI